MLCGGERNKKSLNVLLFSSLLCIIYLKSRIIMLASKAFIVVLLCHVTAVRAIECRGYLHFFALFYKCFFIITKRPSYPLKKNSLDKKSLKFLMKENYIF